MITKKGLNFRLILFYIASLKAVRTGLEPATPCVTGMYSNQLNYRTILFCFLLRGFLSRLRMQR